MGSSGGCADNHPFLGRLPIVGRAFRNEVGATGRKISSQESYDSETATLGQTVKIQEELTVFRVKCEKRSDELEEEALSAARENIDEMIEFLRNINSKTYAGQKLNINLERLLRDNRQTEDIIRGYTKKRIQKKVSLDNSECLDILKMDAGKEKERAMTDFLNKIFRTSMDGLIREIRKSLKKQVENVEDQINARIDSYTDLSKEKLLQLQEIEEVKSFDENELEKKLADLEYLHSLCGVGLNLLK